MSRLQVTHTLAHLEVSKSTYDEIAGKLREAGWDHAFLDGVIDMHGVGLVKSSEDPEGEVDSTL